MTALAAVLLGALVLLLGVIAWGVLRPPAPPPGTLDGRLRHRLVVTLKSGESFGGVLWEADERVWVLRNAHALAAGENATDLAVDGEVLLMAADIAYAQKP